MRGLWNKKEILTLPNALSAFRLVLIPLIVWLYVGRARYGLVVGLILLSAATDLADGMIARHLHMVSDFGKMLDPFADKLTQAALLLCLLSRYEEMWALLLVFALCEGAKMTLGLLIAEKQGRVTGAKWYGKLNTVVIYAMILLLILFPQMNPALVRALMLICGGVMIAAHVLYFIFLGRILREERRK